MNYKHIEKILTKDYLGKEPYPIDLGLEDFSNCFGFPIYLIDGYDSSRPLDIQHDDMIHIINTYFRKTSTKKGSLVTFWDLNEKSEFPLEHAALMINETEIVQQRNQGDVFEKKPLEQERLVRPQAFIQLYKQVKEFKFPVVNNKVIVGNYQR